MLPAHNPDTAVSMFERLLEATKPRSFAPRRSIKEPWKFSDYEELQTGVESPNNNNSRGRASLKVGSELSQLVCQVQVDHKPQGLDLEPTTPLSNRSNSILEATRSRISSSGGASWSVFSEISNVEQPILKIDGAGPEIEGFAYISAETYLQVLKNHVDENGFLHSNSEHLWRSNNSDTSFETDHEFPYRKFETKVERSSSSHGSVCSRRSSSTIRKGRYRKEEGPRTAKEQKYRTSATSSSTSFEDLKPSKQICPGFSNLNGAGDLKLSLNSIFERPAAHLASNPNPSTVEPRLPERPPANSFSGRLNSVSSGNKMKQERNVEQKEPSRMVQPSNLEFLNPHLIQQSHEHGKQYRLITFDCRYAYEYQGGHLKGALNLASPQAAHYMFTELKDMLMSNTFLDELLARSGRELTIQELHTISSKLKLLKSVDIENELDSDHTNHHQAPHPTKLPRKNFRMETKENSEVIPVFVLHCEFSSQRAPNMYNLIRQIDRNSNKVYPKLAFPQMFMIRGGYEACSKVGKLPYRRMLHDEFQAECALSENVISQEWKLLKKLKSNQSQKHKASLAKTSRVSTGIPLSSMFGSGAKAKSIFSSQHLDLQNVAEQDGILFPQRNPIQPKVLDGLFDRQGVTATQRLFGSLTPQPCEDLFGEAGHPAQFFSR